ncbi:transcriptional repressor NrdR [bacterium BMS3Abin02]|nr:transcriptional repressor NrdR [bacterium BMS3Abin02]GBE21710.1 transcriptional repressor NrdR [bacterium BMS3Bbin01]HDH27366.1 transcriptional repressor NrdR [Actinomycetota bacterium]HDK45373.1 transcriptional repressor NrdR [Actinomycetota bacterium]
MQCPFCASEDTRVIDSRPVEEGSAIRRRRECVSCGNRFTTYERADIPLIVRKRDGRLEPFEIDKVRAGLHSALADRPVEAKRLERMLVQIRDDARAQGRVVSSDDIGRAVLEHLAGIDHVAYLRFASVYKEFEGTVDFEREMAELQRREG